MLRRNGTLWNYCLYARRLVITSSRQFPSDLGSKGSELHRQSLQHPEDFWGDASEAISWFRQPTSILDKSSAPFYRWFSGGQMNTCYNCVDRHVEAGHGDQKAIIYDSPVTDTIRFISYKELLDQVQRFSGVMKSHGIQKGDRVIIYMPNIPEAVVAMLSCARLGAIHSVVFGGFAAAELATRIRDCKPKLIVSASCGIDGKKTVEYKPLLDRAVEIAATEGHRVEICVIYQRPQLPAGMIAGRDLDWANEMQSVTSPVKDCVPLESADPLYILYTSGTTGAPKGILRDNAGYAVALQWTMKNIYASKPGEVFWAASDVGWVVGHSYMIYAPLLNRNTTLIYEGKPIGTPDAVNFWRTAQRHDVGILSTAPTALRVMKRVDVHGDMCRQFQMPKLRAVFLAGERADPETIHWVEHALNIPVRDHWWQTETGWPICSNLVGVDGVLPIKHGSTYRACPGYDVQVLDEKNKPVPAGTLGKLAIKLPLPPGCMMTLYNNDARYVESYMKTIPGYYDTGDAGVIDGDDYVHVMSRVDDVINVAGHRLSTGAMEEVMYDHPDIAEAAVVGIIDTLKGHVPLGLFVLNDESKKTEQEIEKELIEMMRDKIGPLACFKNAVKVDALPKTRSGKVVRNVLRAMAGGHPYQVPPTIESMDVVENIEKVIKKHGNFYH